MLCNVKMISSLHSRGAHVVGRASSIHLPLQTRAYNVGPTSTNLLQSIDHIHHYQPLNYGNVS